ncbi:M20 metallopeptidase family protein [Actinomarinicola tropica]|uniref:Amidohydrolase n=1 Tax=Actinomarinicola tropica TaxID=2789776 RepID=A0A5Q2RDH6_9ACTN|nr:M20 family metallopeptidase [Actinomarinicola tropica]QGG93754.1 amidohydrolase [Actinomarinicola tropica]
MTLLDPSLAEDARSLLPDVVDLRRRIHRRPEIGLDLPVTQSAILEALDGLPLEVTTGTALSSVTATLVGARPGRRVLLRGDMDALVMPEDTGVDFASENPGAMHACGHDAHVAMLVGAARMLCARRDELEGSVRFMFQPGEEGSGGAVHMIDEGVLDGVDAAFAIHVTPNLPSGWVATRPGPLMASADEVFVTVRGHGGHASTPHFTADPVPVACEIVGAVQTAITRRVDVFNPAVVTIAQIQAGTTTNVIPETASLSGTIRTTSERTRSRVHEDLERLATGIAAAHGMEADVRIERGYPVTVNDADAAQLVLDVAPTVVAEGARVVEAPAPTMGAEDWSYVLQQVPGAMAFLGVCPPDIADPREAPACHSNRMRLDEPAMATGTALHAAMALRMLEG